MNEDQKTGDVLAQLMMPNPPTGFQQRYGRSKLTEQMGGEPGFWGPLQRLLFGDNLPLYGMPADQARLIMQGQMGQSQEISDVVPR
jgi:hypothetical protein